MKISRGFFRKKSNVVTALAIAAFVLFGVKKVFDYGTPPTKDKDCDFVYPVSAARTKPVEVLSKLKKAPIVFEQQGGTVNDASCLNKTAVYGVVKVSSVDDIKAALQFARANNLKVTSAGQRHSMGGQSFVGNGLVLDMRSFDQMDLDKERRILRVQAGVTWAKVQELLDQEGLSVKAMQSINIFTVGGTLSVNAHGIAHDPGQIAPTVKSMRVMLSDGQVVVTSPTENVELFRHVLGGYGLFGVILDADLEVVPNEVYKWSTQYTDYRNFSDFYKKNVENNDELGLMYARLSVSPKSYLAETAIHTFEKTVYDAPIPKIRKPRLTWFSRMTINFSKTGGFGRWVRWMLEKYVEPRLHACILRRQAASPNEVCLVSRNQEMYDSMGYLKNNLHDTDVLQEYFIPEEKMAEFVDGLRDTVKKNGANLLNVTIRIVHKDTVTALPYAKDDRFAFVLYFNQKLNEEAGRVLQKTTADLIDVATNLGGTYYLPYQLYYSEEQLHKAYPEIDAFFAAKKKYDPNFLFVNTWYEKYEPNADPPAPPK